MIEENGLKIIILWLHTIVMCAGDDIVLSHLARRKIDGGGCTWRQMTQKYRADNPEHCAELKYFGPN